MSEGVSKEVLESISIPNFVDSRIGRLEFTDGAPNQESVDKIYDHLDFMHAVNAYMNAFAGASTYAMRQGFIDAGADDDAFLIFSELMDSHSLFLTANADTVYYVGIIDLSGGPKVLETPPEALGVHRRHVVAVGHRLRSSGTGQG